MLLRYSWRNVYQVPQLERFREVSSKLLQSLRDGILKYTRSFYLFLYTIHLSGSLIEKQYRGKLLRPHYEQLVTIKIYYIFSHLVVHTHRSEYAP